MGQAQFPCTPVDCIDSIWPSRPTCSNHKRLKKKYCSRHTKLDDIPHCYYDKHEKFHTKTVISHKCSHAAEEMHY